MRMSSTARLVDVNKSIFVQWLARFLTQMIHLAWSCRVGTMDWYSIIDGVIFYFSLIEYRFDCTFSLSISNHEGRQFSSPPCNFFSFFSKTIEKLCETCRTIIIIWRCCLILTFLILNWDNDVIPQVDDVALLVKILFYTFAQVFISISKYSVRFDL